MPPRESAAVSTGRSSAFASGTGENNLTVPGVLTGMAKAAPGVVKTMVKNEYEHDKTLGAGGLYNRARAGAFNFGADVISGGEHLVSGAVNAGATEIQHRLSDVGAGLTNWASSSMTGKSAGAQGSDHYRDVKPIPEISIPNITPEGEAFGGGIDRDPKVGTLSSLGTYVPGDPLESANRMVNAAGFLIPGGAGRVLGKGISKITGKAVTEGAETGAKAATTAAKDFAPTASNVRELKPKGKIPESGGYENQGALAVKPDIKTTAVETPSPRKNPFTVIKGEGIGGEAEVPGFVKGVKSKTVKPKHADAPDGIGTAHKSDKGDLVDPSHIRNPGRSAASAAAGHAVGTNSSFAPASSPASAPSSAISSAPAPAAAADPLDKTKPKDKAKDKDKDKTKRRRNFDVPDFEADVLGKPTKVVRAK